MINKKIKTDLFQLVGGALAIVVLVLVLGIAGIGIILVLSGVFYWVAFNDGAKSIQDFIKRKTA